MRRLALLLALLPGCTPYLDAAISVRLEVSGPIDPQTIYAAGQVWEVCGVSLRADGEQVLRVDAGSDALPSGRPGEYAPDGRILIDVAHFNYVSAGDWGRSVIFAHEIGHAFGIEHIDLDGPLMSGSNIRTDKPVQEDMDAFARTTGIVCHK